MSINKTLQERLDFIEERISNIKFQTNQGLSNEVGFHLFCYDPCDEMIVRDYINVLGKNNNSNYRIIAHDLYCVFLDILKEKKILHKINALEEKKGSEFLLHQIEKIVLPNKFVEYMYYEPHNVGDIIVLTGVGKVFPYMRTDQLMEHLQIHFSDIPVIIFYPGDFTGTGVKLFNQLPVRPYYRAFNLIT